jgi:hypothetical protein
VSGAGQPPWCAWSVLAATRTVDYACHTATFNAEIEGIGVACFSACPGPRNASSACYVNCFYDTVLGTGSASGLPQSGSAIPLARLRDIWTGAMHSCAPV